MDAVFGKNGDKGADGDAQDPIPEDLSELHIKIVPEVNKFPVKNVKQIIHNDNESFRP